MSFFRKDVELEIQVRPTRDKETDIKIQKETSDFERKGGRPNECGEAR